MVGNVHEWLINDFINDFMNDFMDDTWGFVSICGHLCRGKDVWVVVVFALAAWEGK